MPLKRQKISKTTINNLYNVCSVCEKINKSIKFSSSLTSRKNAKYHRKDTNRHSRSRNWKNKYLTRLTKEKAEKINIGKQLRANSEDGTIQNSFLPFPSVFFKVFSSQVIRKSSEPGFVRIIPRKKMFFSSRRFSDWEVNHFNNASNARFQTAPLH